MRKKKELIIILGSLLVVVVLSVTLAYFTTEIFGTGKNISVESTDLKIIFTNGSVGLIYSSDYGYGVLASDCARTVKPYNYDETTLCHNNNWLFQGSNQWQRFIGPSASRANLSFGVEANGCAHSGNYVINLGAYSPVMALSKDVLVSGSGTKTDPYVIIM